MDLSALFRGDNVLITSVIRSRDRIPNAIDTFRFLPANLEPRKVKFRSFSDQYLIFALRNPKNFYVRAKEYRDVRRDVHGPLSDGSDTVEDGLENN